jgi:outer membrane receptor protein involved in Fe transport
LAYALSISGALRYEHYSNGLGSIVTPKLGVIYAPTADFDIKGTWGRSFKVPTLMQQYSSPRISLYPAAAWGGVGYPANATFLHPYGGNPDLKPERATTWSVTADLHPRVIDGLQIGLSYFHIDYRDRVLMPITNRAVALSDPAFREFVTFNPSAAEQAALIAMAPAGLANFAGAAYDPANVVAIVNDTYLNVAHQIIHGVDLSSDYRFDWAGGDVDLSGNASWLTSRQQNSADGPVFALAGTEFNAPHFRARAGVTVHHGNLTASSFLNYIGRVKDLQTTPPVEGASMATIDLTLLYRLDRDSALLRGTELSLSIQNLANERPPYLHSAAPYIVDYDSNNYSALGRFVSVGISKHW